MSPDRPSGGFEESWSKTVVPAEALERALYSMAEQVSGSVRDAGDEWVAVVEPRNALADTVALRHLLRQEVTDQSLRLKIAARTDPIRNLIFAVAFSKTDVSQAPGSR